MPLVLPLIAVLHNFVGSHKHELYRLQDHYIGFLLVCHNDGIYINNNLILLLKALNLRLLNNLFVFRLVQLGLFLITESLCKQPQDLVFPEVRLFVVTMVVFPQMHLQFQYLFPFLE